jgi:hypothetical protein
MRGIIGVVWVIYGSYSHEPAHSRGGLVTFSLDEKVTKKSSQKKASTLQAILPGPLF